MGGSMLAGGLHFRRSMQCRTRWWFEKVGIECETNQFLRCFGGKLVANIR